MTLDLCLINEDATLAVEGLRTFSNSHTYMSGRDNSLSLPALQVVGAKQDSRTGKVLVRCELNLTALQDHDVLPKHEAFSPAPGKARRVVSFALELTEDSGVVYLQALAYARDLHNAGFVISSSGRIQNLQGRAAYGYYSLRFEPSLEQGWVRIQLDNPQEIEVQGETRLQFPVIDVGFAGCEFVRSVGGQAQVMKNSTNLDPFAVSATPAVPAAPAAVAALAGTDLF